VADRFSEVFLLLLYPVRRKFLSYFLGRLRVVVSFLAVCFFFGWYLGAIMMSFKIRINVSMTGG
jgi:hypothetical protein